MQTCKGELCFCKHTVMAMDVIASNNFYENMLAMLQPTFCL